MYFSVSDRLNVKVDSARSKPSRPTAGIIGPQKLDARRLQMLTKQRERLEEEVKALESEVNALVSE